MLKQCNTVACRLFLWASQIDLGVWQEGVLCGHVEKMTFDLLYRRLSWFRETGGGLVPCAKCIMMIPVEAGASEGHREAFVGDLRASSHPSGGTWKSQWVWHSDAAKRWDAGGREFERSFLDFKMPKGNIAGVLSWIIWQSQDECGLNMFFRCERVKIKSSWMSRRRKWTS